MRTVRILTALAVAAAMQLGTAEAANMRTACKADYKRFCSDVSPGGGRIVKCLKENEASISQACKSALAEAKEERANKTSETPAH